MFVSSYWNSFFNWICWPDGHLCAAHLRYGLIDKKHSQEKNANDLCYFTVLKDKSFNLFETCGMHWENPYVDIITDGKSFNCFIVGWLLCILNKSVTRNFRRTIARREGHRFISCRMIAETNSTAHERRTITYQEIMRSSTYVGKVGQIASFFSAANIILSIIAFLGNFLILVALNKESSLHSSSKLLYCCLATSRCVGWSC